MCSKAMTKQQLTWISILEKEQKQNKKRIESKAWPAAEQTHSRAAGTVCMQRDVGVFLLSLSLSIYCSIDFGFNLVGGWVGVFRSRPQTLL